MDSPRALGLRFQDNSKLHDDVVLEFAGQEYTCDSYYFALDNRLLPEQEDDEKIRLVMRRLLEQWLEAARSLSDGSQAFLPFDLSDQCSRWIRCERRGDDFALALGWSDTEGWSFSPSDIGELLFALRNFHADTPEVVMGGERFEGLIAESIAAI
ncbi:MAG: hypothetical protein AB7K71_23535 [Polyangiaceae bacterium]